MGLKTQVVLLAIIIAIIAIIARASGSGSSHDDGNSVTALARSMNQKFQELFDRLDRLELKMNTIIADKGNNQSGNVRGGYPGGAEVVDSLFSIRVRRG